MTVNNNVNATLAGKAEAVFGAVTVELGRLGAAIDGRIKAAIVALAVPSRAAPGIAAPALMEEVRPQPQMVASCTVAIDE